jgi:hypothetical protein
MAERQGFNAVSSESGKLSRLSRRVPLWGDWLLAEQTKIGEPFYLTQQ